MKKLLVLTGVLVTLSLTGVAFYSLISTQKKVTQPENSLQLTPAANGKYAMQFVEIPIKPIEKPVIVSPSPISTKKPVVKSTPKPTSKTQQSTTAPAASPTSTPIAPQPLPTPTIEPIVENPEIETKKQEIEKFYAEQQKKYNQQKQKQEEINKLTTFLKKYNSPIASNNYSELIINLAQQNKSDYKVIVAIMGVESGFCHANYKKYNCFGYLNGVEYSGYDTALTAIVPRISREYVNKYGTNFTALAKAYGMMATEYQANKLSIFYSELH